MNYAGGVATQLIEGRELAVWPAGQPVDRWIEPTVYIARFADAGMFQDRLRRTILDLAARAQTGNEIDDGSIGSGKVYDVDKWGCPAASLVDRRARFLFSIATKRREVVADLSWASIYRSGDYCMPHSHPRTTASVLYVVDLGDGGDPSNGQFCFADPRMAACCREQPGCMSTPCAPELAPGTMLLFPGQAVHFVTVYRGTRPRITMSWNLNHAALAGEAIPYAVNRL